MLEKENIPIGVVEKIAAPSTLHVELTGVGGHAGAVLMPERHDALLTGAEIALAVEKAALNSGRPDTVATTGVFRLGEEVAECLLVVRVGSLTSSGDRSK